MFRERMEKTTGDEYQRTMWCQDIKNDTVEPQYSESHGKKGIFVGQPRWWIPILIRDRLIPRNLVDVCVVKIKPPKGIDVVVNEYEGVEEGFIVTDVPAPVISKEEPTRDWPMRKLMDVGYSDFLNQDDFDDEDEYKKYLKRISEREERK